VGGGDGAALASECGRDGVQPRPRGIAALATKRLLAPMPRARSDSGSTGICVPEASEAGPPVSRASPAWAHGQAQTPVGEERSGYEDRLGHQTRSLTPRLVPVPPPPDEARQAATVADNKQRATTHSFAWHLIDPLKDGFELLIEATGRPLARLTIGGIGTPSARLDVGDQRLLFTTNELGNPQVAITDASTRTVVAKFEWQRLGRQGTLRFMEGGQLRWRRTSRWRRTFTFVDRFGNLLLRFYPDGRASAMVSTPRWSCLWVCGMTSRCYSPWDGSCWSAPAPQHRSNQLRCRNSAAGIAAPCPEHGSRRVLASPDRCPSAGPGEPSGQPSWLMASLAVVGAILALSGGLAVLAARRAGPKSSGRAGGLTTARTTPPDGAAAPTR
jgi:hypothetical protein